MTLPEIVTLEMIKMLARRLDYSPAAEDLPMTVKVMVDDLRHKGLTDDDAQRVQVAFSVLGGKIQKWPTPLMVMGALPKHAPPVEIGYQPQRTRNIDDVMPDLRRSIGHKNKRQSVMLPGEGYDDFRRAYEQSNITMEQFREMRLAAPRPKQIDDEAAIERAAIQAESNQ